MIPNNFIDAQDELVPGKLKTTVCIIGAGAAGITMARNMSVTDDVILIESGDFEMDGRTQSLYSGSNTGLPYHDLLTCRLRYFGGTTNHWGGYCRANDSIDYEGRENMGMPTWPVGQKELEPYIEKAAYELGISSNFFNPVPFLHKKGISPDALLDKQSTDFFTKIFQISTKVRFSKMYKDELAKQNNLRVYLNLNAIHIQLSSIENRVTSVKCKTLDGKEIEIEATVVVLACHAIENARLLLNSNDIHESGVGNKYDHVGRYFMDHVQISASKLIPSDKFPSLYDRSVMSKLNLNANLAFNDDYLRKSGILQYYCRFDPVYTDAEVIDALRGIKNNLIEPFSLRLLDDLKVVMNDIGGAADFSLVRMGVAQPAPKYYQLQHRIEQAPNPESRVTLSNKRDFLGKREVDLEWKLNEFDYRTFSIGHDKIIKDLSAMGLGRFVVEKITSELVDARVKGHFHHIGTTRMSLQPKDGVVDANCKVHGVSNLYIAGSSIFPTAGYSGPTMMIVAFAMRLAEHLTDKWTN